MIFLAASGEIHSQVDVTLSGYQDPESETSSEQLIGSQAVGDGILDQFGV